MRLNWSFWRNFLKNFELWKIWRRWRGWFEWFWAFSYHMGRFQVISGHFLINEEKNAISAFPLSVALGGFTIESQPKPCSAEMHPMSVNVEDFTVVGSSILNLSSLFLLLFLPLYSSHLYITILFLEMVATARPRRRRLQKSLLWSPRRKRRSQRRRERRR